MFCGSPVPLVQQLQCWIGLPSHTHNTGCCKKTGKSFGEVIEHFVVGGNEAYLLADAYGDLKVVGTAGNRKHKMKMSSYRGSITMFRTGTAAGNNGPTAFLMKGVQFKQLY